MPKIKTEDLEIKTNLKPYAILTKNLRGKEETVGVCRMLDTEAETLNAKAEATNMTYKPITEEELTTFKNA